MSEQGATHSGSVRATNTERECLQSNVMRRPAVGYKKVPLTILAPADPRPRDRYQARFALIRPDQHVAWRGDTMPADLDRLFAQITGAEMMRAAANVASPLGYADF
jgi:hypothetical protein